MSEHQAARTLVKSAPELWTACSEEAWLARHLKPFGEIRITRLEPETAVAWEGENVSGTVRLEPAGWGTRVILTAWEGEPPIAEVPEPPVAEVPEPPVAEIPEPPVAGVPEPPVAGVPEPPVAGVPEPPVAGVPEPPVAGVPEPEPVAEAAAPVAPEPEVTPAQLSTPAPRVGFWKRWLARRRAKAVSQPVVAVVAPAVELVADPVIELVAEPVAETLIDPVPEPVIERVAEPLIERAAEPVVERVAEPIPEPELVPVASSEPPVPAAPGLDPKGVLDAALDSLGMAHHRPFSRG